MCGRAIACFAVPVPTRQQSNKERKTMAAVVQSIRPAETDLPATPVHRTSIDHPSAWKVADFGSPADYTIELTASQLADIKRAVGRINDSGLSLADLRREHFDMPALKPVIDEIRHQIEDGRGFVVVRRLPVE